MSSSFEEEGESRAMKFPGAECQYDDVTSSTATFCINHYQAEVRSIHENNGLNSINLFFNLTYKNVCSNRSKNVSNTKVKKKKIVKLYENELFFDVHPYVIRTKYNSGKSEYLRMDHLIRLTTQNPLSVLVSSYIMKCPNENCSGHGECLNGTCFCEIQYDGEECHAPNVPYYVAFASIFFVLALVSMVQLIMCVVAEYHKMKSPSILRACRITTQKLLYFLVFLAAVIRGAYFTSPTGAREGWSSSLMSAYYPLLLSGSSLIVCLWAEPITNCPSFATIKHLSRDIHQWRSPQKSNAFVHSSHKYDLLRRKLKKHYLHCDDRVRSHSQVPQRTGSSPRESGSLPNPIQMWQGLLTGHSMAGCRD